VLLRPLRGRRRIDQILIIGVPVTVIAACGAVGLSLHRQRVQAITEEHLKAAAQFEVPTRIAWNVTLEEFAGTFQGKLNTGQTSAWLILEIDHPRIEDEFVTFHYTINSPTRRRSGNGTASLAGRWIHLGTLKGQIVRNGDGSLTFRSMPRDAKPEWTLEASR